MYGGDRDVDSLLAVIRAFDVPERLYRFQVEIYELQLSDSFSYGFEGFLKKNFDVFGGVLPALNTPSYSSVIKGVQGSFAVSDYLSILMSLLEKSSYLSSISKPNISCHETKECKIEVGNQLPVLNQQSTAVTGQITQSVQYLSTGVVVQVNPVAQLGSGVRVKLQVSISAGMNNNLSTLDSPMISTRLVSSELVFKPGETLMIAGLMTKDNSYNKEGPNLSLFSNAFGYNNKKSNKSEILILVRVEDAKR